jgi:putative ABC transport system ATP-binding protein
MELLSEIHKTGNTILFVTHNPELTRYATRVVYMHDGAIVQDEPTRLGEIAATARKVMFTLPVRSEEDDLEGVSTLMHALPQKEAAKTKKPAAKKKTKRTRSTRTARSKK